MLAIKSEAPEGEIVANLRESFEKALSELELGSEPALLYEPASYILASGGKRLRPVLLLLTSQAFRIPVDKAMPAALAIEVFHNFTLVHDDIMDHAETRRGRQAVHKKWDEATAILSGDYLMALSYELLSRLPEEYVLSVLESYHSMVRMLCEGQAMDKAFETEHKVTLESYMRMIDRKTGALIQASFEIGGILGDAGDYEIGRLRALGKHVGRAFQIQDDLLDLIAENHKWGKKVGGDLTEGKKTYLLLRALEKTEGEAHALFRSVIKNGGIEERKISIARTYMEENGVISDAADAVLEHTESAMKCLDALPPGKAVDTIRWLIQRMQKRLH